MHPAGVSKLPFAVGDRVQVVGATDPDIHDVTPHLGKVGRVIDILIGAGIGDSYPEDPVIKVRFVKKYEVFWAEA